LAWSNLWLMIFQLNLALGFKILKGFEWRCDIHQNDTWHNNAQQSVMVYVLFCCYSSNALLLRMIWRNTILQYVVMQNVMASFVQLTSIAIYNLLNLRTLPSVSLQLTVSIFFINGTN